MNKILIIFISALLVGIIIGLSINNFLPTGQAISNPNEYSYTTAICNNNNECIDVLVKCHNGEVTSLEPTSKLIKLNNDWQDPREQEGFCE